MADYINIYGQDILAVASDPANPTLGQIWYNSTSNTLKGGGVTTAGAWASGNNLNTTRTELSGAGTQTVGLAFGGSFGGPSAKTGATEEYDGTSWTSVNSMNTARDQLAGAGIQTSALAFGGETPPNTGATEEYDGNSWTTSPSSLATARSLLGGVGTQTSALAFGGGTPPGFTAATEEWTGAGSPLTVTITAS